MAKAKAVKAGKAVAVAPATATPPAAIAGTGSPGPIPGLAAAGAAVTDLADFLAADTGTVVAAAPAAGKKSSVPTKNIPELAEATREFVEGQRLVKDGEGMIANAATKIKPVAERHRVAHSRATGENQLSLSINGLVTFTVGRYRQLKETAGRKYGVIQAAAESIFGPGGFKKYFSVEAQYVVRKEATTPANIKFLQEVLGARFNEFIEREVVIKPNDDLHKARTLLPEVEKQYEQARLHVIDGQALVTPNEPTLK
jgi:hypothetical protein